tara:strand:- start:1334 stop:2002 length:669 start_codon:yes stop_codon:yes gene_type:complete
MSIFCFDLDGTIFDSLDGINESLNYSLVKNSFSKVKKKILSTLIGPPLESYLEKLISINLSKESKDKILNDFRLHHNSSGYKSYKTYPEVKAVLNKIKNYSNNKVLAVTNKPYQVSKKALIYFGLYKYFDDIFTADGNTDNCYKWSKEINRNKSNYLNFLDANNVGNKFYIGDTESDYLATLGNSFHFIYAKYGYGKSFKLSEDSFALESFDDLKNLFNGEK